MISNFSRYFAHGSNTLILFVFFIVLSGIPAAAQSPIVWFAPRNQPPIQAPDFMELFQPNTPWPKAFSRVQVFQLFPQFVHNASDADLQTVFVNLQQRHIALAIEYGLLNPNDPRLCGGKGPRCEQGEGFGGAFLAADLARIKTLGGNLQSWQWMSLCGSAITAPSQALLKHRSRGLQMTSPSGLQSYTVIFQAP